MLKSGKWNSYILTRLGLSAFVSVDIWQGTPCVLSCHKYYVHYGEMKYKQMENFKPQIPHWHASIHQGFFSQILVQC